ELGLDPRAHRRKAGLARHRARSRRERQTRLQDIAIRQPHSRLRDPDRRRADDSAAHPGAAHQRAIVQPEPCECVMNIPVYPENKVALKGKKGLIVGIANDQSIAWGCAKAFRALGAELAVTYLNEKAKKHVEPLAKTLESPIFEPLDAMVEGETEKVF